MSSWKAANVGNAINGVMTILSSYPNVTDEKLDTYLRNVMPNLSGEDIATAIETARSFADSTAKGSGVTANYEAVYETYQTLASLYGHEGAINALKGMSGVAAEDIAAIEENHTALQNAQTNMNASMIATLPAMITAISTGDTAALNQNYDALKTLLPTETLAAYNAAEDDDTRILVLFNYAKDRYNSDKSAENAALYNAVGDASVKDDLLSYTGKDLIGLAQKVLNGDFATKDHVSDQLAIIGESISITNDNKMSFSTFDLDINGETMKIALGVDEILTEAPKERIAKIGSLRSGSKEYYINQDGILYIKSETEEGTLWTRTSGFNTAKRDDLTDDEYELICKALVAYHFG